MKWTQTFITTLREDPQDAEIISHNLLVRGGFIRKLTAGAYSYLPLGFKVLLKVKNIIRDEMVKAGADILVLGSSSLFRKDISIPESIVEIKKAIDIGLEGRK